MNVITGAPMVPTGGMPTNPMMARQPMNPLPPPMPVPPIVPPQAAGTFPVNKDSASVLVIVWRICYPDRLWLRLIRWLT